jgi:heptosyltransferase I
MNYWVYHYLDRYIGIPMIFLLKFFEKIFFHKKKIFKIKKILVIKLTMMGDTILLYPAVKALKEKYSDCELTFLCSKVNYDIVKMWNFIDKIVVFRFDLLFKKPWIVITQIFELLKEKFDLAIDFEQWFRNTAIVAFLAAKVSVGFKTPKQFKHYLFDVSVSHKKGRHEVLCFCDLVKTVGVEVEDKSLFLKIDKTAEEKIKNLLKSFGIEEKKFVIIHPGCGIHGYYRQWDVEKYAEVAEYIYSKGYQVVITGSKDDIQIANKLQKLIPFKTLNLAGKTNLQEIINLINLSKFIICGNTGVLHIAAALNIPTIVIHGPTDPNKWGPWGKGHIVIKSNLNCAPCLYLGFEYACKEKKCLKNIQPDVVKKTIDEISR